MIGCLEHCAECVAQDLESELVTSLGNEEGEDNIPEGGCFTNEKNNNEGAKEDHKRDDDPVLPCLLTFERGVEFPVITAVVVPRHENNWPTQESHTYSRNLVAD